MKMDVLDNGPDVLGPRKLWLECWTLKLFDFALVLLMLPLNFFIFFLAREFCSLVHGEYFLFLTMSIIDFLI